MTTEESLVFTGLHMARAALADHRGKLFSKNRKFIDRRISILDELINDLEIFYHPYSTNTEKGI
jgi:hypothetical protein